MEDEQIIRLYWDRLEIAISETDAKYGPYCSSIAYNILQDKEDTEECVSDTYLDAWNTIPPTRPRVLSAFLGKITRRISIDRWRSKHRAKRGGGEIPLALEELGECIADSRTVESEFDRTELVRALDRFLGGLGETERKVFLRRYWYLDSVEDISARFGFSRSKTTSMLHRIRGRLRAFLAEEGFE